MGQKLPRLKEHFDNLMFSSEIYLQLWYMTIFTCFPMALTIRIWDHLLAEGLVYMFKFPLAVMEILEEKLLAEELDGVNEIIMTLRR